MDATTIYPGARPHTPSSSTHHDTPAILQPHQPANTTAIPPSHQSANTTDIPQLSQSTNTITMPFLTFETGPNYYGYDKGVNAANLTLKDIQSANSRLAPARQRRINGGLLRATRDDPGFVSPKSAATKGFCDYAKWTKVEILEAMIARGLASNRTRSGDM
jgi:hypothetical protein